jgi:hypothetical protein
MFRRFCSGKALAAALCACAFAGYASIAGAQEAPVMGAVLGRVLVQSVTYKSDGNFALILKAVGSPDDMQIALQPCRVTRVFGKLEAGRDTAGRHPAITALDDARRTGASVAFGWEGAGFRSVQKQQPCTVRATSLRATRERGGLQVLAVAQVRPAVKLAQKP